MDKDKEIADLRAKLVLSKAREEELKKLVSTFGTLWAVSAAKSNGLPDGALMSHHYDVLELAGVRMDDFKRAALAQIKGDE